jgi:hypothetical protein
MAKILSSGSPISTDHLKAYLELASCTYRRLVRLRKLPEEEPFCIDIDQWRAILESTFDERAQAYRSCSKPLAMTKIVVELANLFVQEVRVRASHEGHLL